MDWHGGSHGRAGMDVSGERQRGALMGGAGNYQSIATDNTRGREW